MIKYVTQIKYVDMRAQNESISALTTCVMLGLISVAGISLMLIAPAFFIEQWTLNNIRNFGFGSYLVGPLSLVVVGFLLLVGGKGLSSIESVSVRVFYGFAIPILMLLLLRYHANIYMDSLRALLHSVPNPILEIYPPFPLWLNDVFSYDFSYAIRDITKLILHTLNKAIPLGISKWLFVLGFAAIFNLLTVLMLKNKYSAKALTVLFKALFIIGFGGNFLAYFMHITYFLST